MSHLPGIKHYDPQISRHQQVGLVKQAPIMQVLIEFMFGELQEFLTKVRINK